MSLRSGPPLWKGQPGGFQRTAGDLSRPLPYYDYGAGRARRIRQLSQEGVRDLVAMLKHKRIDCDLVGRNAIYR
jgi:hypothetical protein